MKDDQEYTEGCGEESQKVTWGPSLFYNSGALPESLGVLFVFVPVLCYARDGTANLWPKVVNERLKEGS